MLACKSCEGKSESTTPRSPQRHKEQSRMQEGVKSCDLTGISPTMALNASPSQLGVKKKRSVVRVLCRALLLSVLGLLIYTNIVVRKILRQDQDREVDLSEHNVHQSPFGHHHICPNSMNFLNMQNIESAFIRAENFHNGGGGLKSVETLLNSAIDDAYRLSGAKYTPEGSDSIPVSSDASISAAIKKSLISNDKHNRGGYDQRKTPGTLGLDNNILVIKKSRDIVNVVEPWDGKRWEYGLGPVDPSICKSMDTIKTKKKRYEEKFMCSYNDLLQDSSAASDDSIEQERNKGSLRKSNHAASQQKCEMISIGSNGEWGFEEAVQLNTNCVTHTFDCTVSENPRKPNIDSINFYPFCISSKNEVKDGREYATYSQIIEKTGMTTPPALFKIDVEGFEYDVMAQMLDEAEKNNKMHMLPNQISVELHYATRMYDVPWMSRSVTTAEIAMFVGMMYRKGGYMISHHKAFGPGCYACAEILFVRTFCL